MFKSSPERSHRFTNNHTRQKNLISSSARRSCKSPFSGWEILCLICDLAGFTWLSFRHAVVFRFAFFTNLIMLHLKLSIWVPRGRRSPAARGRAEARTRTRLQAAVLLAAAAFVCARSCAAPHVNAASRAAAADRFRRSGRDPPLHADVTLPGWSVRVNPVETQHRDRRRRGGKGGGDLARSVRADARAREGFVVCC